MPSTADPAAREVLAAAQECFLRKDMQGFAELFAADGVHELPFAPPGVPRRIEGREEIRRYLTSITDTPIEMRAFEDMVVHETADPEVVIVEYTASGVVRGGRRPYRMPYLQVLRARHGRIVLWRDYWSPLDGVRAVGLPVLVFSMVRSRLRRRR